MPPPGPPDQSPPKTMTAAQAKNMELSNRMVRFESTRGDEYIGNLMGWTDRGFILKDGNRIDTLGYSGLNNWITVETRKRNTITGTRTGVLVGLASSLIYFFIAKNQARNYAGADGLFLIKVVAVSPLIILASIGIGSYIGSHTHKYEQYYISMQLFRDNPYVFPAYYDLLLKE
jgi:hypothetical protein